MLHLEVFITIIYILVKHRCRIKLNAESYLLQVHYDNVQYRIAVRNEGKHQYEQKPPIKDSLILHLFESLIFIDFLIWKLTERKQKDT